MGITYVFMTNESASLTMGHLRCLHEAYSSLQVKQGSVDRHGSGTGCGNANRHARKAKAGGSFTLQEWQALCAYYDYTCLRCGRQEPDIELTVDHVVPLSQGGRNSIENLQPLCRACNLSKHAKTIDYRPYFRR